MLTVSITIYRYFGQFTQSVIAATGRYILAATTIRLMFLFMLFNLMKINVLGYTNDDRIADLVFEPNLLWKNQDVTLAFVNGNQAKQLHFRRIYFQWFLPNLVHNWIELSFFFV